MFSVHYFFKKKLGGSLPWKLQIQDKDLRNNNNTKWKISFLKPKAKYRFNARLIFDFAGDQEQWVILVVLQISSKD